MRKYTPTDQEIAAAREWADWGKEPSKFEWYYDDKETCYILEGKARVHAGEEILEFEQGDMVEFEKGLSCTWEIEEAIKKKYRFG